MTRRKKLRIGMIAPLFAAVPPKGYGGTELVVSLLTEELVRRGHHVTLYASGNSRTRAKLRSITPVHLFAKHVPVSETRLQLLNLSRAFQDAGQFDIIHSHVDLYDLLFSPFVKTPLVFTLHQPLRRWEGIEWFDMRLQIARAFRHNNFVAISRSIRQVAEVKLNWVRTILHGIQVQDFSFNPKPENHAAYLNRPAKIKGVEWALRGAQQAKIPLVLAGPPLSHQQFTTDVVRPLIRSSGASWVGEVALKDKSTFLGRAKVLINPIQWDEPFGLVMIEAMACGTPVIATRRGAAPEIVVNGKTGFLVSTIPELVRAIRRIDQIDRRACRAHVEKYFRAERMVDEYEELYYDMIQKRRQSSVRWPGTGR